MPGRRPRSLRLVLAAADLRRSRRQEMGPSPEATADTLIDPAAFATVCLLGTARGCESTRLSRLVTRPQERPSSALRPWTSNVQRASTGQSKVKKHCTSIESVQPATVRTGPDCDVVLSSHEALASFGAADASAHVELRRQPA
mmetsp:Transcript_7377/g.22733  ORF Transcript_7377/g.22733 Transcript_7377/m.22733 type:complete len:143 (+) Transcript_7377:830-1258(+)